MLKFDTATQPFLRNCYGTFLKFEVTSEVLRGDIGHEEFISDMVLWVSLKLTHEDLPSRVRPSTPKIDRVTWVFFKFDMRHRSY